MAISTQDIDLNDPLRSVGPDSTACFDESPSNPTEYACTENLSAAKPEDDEDLDEEEDDDEEEEEEDDEEDDDDDDDEEEEDDDELKVASR
jgi:hypothetical protein